MPEPKDEQGLGGGMPGMPGMGGGEEQKGGGMEQPQKEQAEQEQEELDEVELGRKLASIYSLCLDSSEATGDIIKKKPYIT